MGCNQFTLNEMFDENSGEGYILELDLEYPKNYIATQFFLKA